MAGTNNPPDYSQILADEKMRKRPYSAISTIQQAFCTKRTKPDLSDPQEFFDLEENKLEVSERFYWEFPYVFTDLVTLNFEITENSDKISFFVF